MRKQANGSKLDKIMTFLYNLPRHPRSKMSDTSWHVTCPLCHFLTRFHQAGLLH